jgi:hypothetical protein
MAMLGYFGFFVAFFMWFILSVIMTSPNLTVSGEVGANPAH